MMILKDELEKLKNEYYVAYDYYRTNRKTWNTSRKRAYQIRLKELEEKIFITMDKINK